MGSVLRPLFISASRSSRAEHLVRSSPLTQPLVSRFVAGETFADARATAERLARKGLLITYDHLGDTFVEHQTTGGYPKIANVIAADLSQVGQLRPRDEVGIEGVSVAQALDLLRDQEARICSLI